MKKRSILVIASLFTTFLVNVFAQTNTYPFDIQKSGQGKQTIIFIPGFASSGVVWDETKSHFEEGYTCYTLTMPGFAGVKPQPNATFEKWASEIVHYIQENNFSKPIIVGHSMGGGLALAIASDYPELIAKIIVVDALPCLPALMNPSFKSKKNKDCTEMIKQMTSMSDEQFHQMQSMTIPRFLEDITKSELVVSWSVKSDRKTFAQMYCDFSNTDLRDRIKTIKCPSLILLEAPFAKLKPVIKEQYKNLKTAKLEFAGKGLHFIMYDDKEWYLNQLEKFITSK